MKKKDLKEIEEEKNRLKKADEFDKDEEEKEKEYMKEIAKQSFAKRLRPYNKPAINIVIGICASCV